MDTSASDISFDDLGRCSYCTEYLSQATDSLGASGTDRDEAFLELVRQVKRAGRGKPYDCVIGVSGGVDSSYALVQAVKAGLRPLAVHMDNGWDSELAQSNIENLIRTLDVDLYTYVIDWDEYRALMQAFFDADVIDVELLYDNAMLAVNYRQAHALRTPHILAGTNFATEGMRTPPGWNWYKYDKRNIRRIGRVIGGVRLASFPAFGAVDLIKSRYAYGISWVSFLDYMDYSKTKAVDLLESAHGYRPYPYKHYESIFTRFYQGFLLPRKFGVDKRRLHLSTLVASGELSRDDAEANLTLSPYPTPQELAKDMSFFLKKMDWSQETLDEYLLRPVIPHDRYGSERWILSSAQRLRGLLPRSPVEKKLPS
jgi:N-acetyl sugar amidotransferase